MKIISLILIVIGFFICLATGIGFRLAVGNILSSLMNSETSGIGQIASAISMANLLSYVNIFGSVIIFLGIILSIVSMFAGKKQNV